jgi:hypothetical protein
MANWHRLRGHCIDNRQEEFGMNALTTRHPHPLWRRLLRYAAIAIGGLIGLELLLVAVLIAINWHDEELTPAAKAWLAEPANPVPDAQNGWLAMITVYLEKQSGTATGRQLVTLIQHNTNIHGQGGISPELGPRWNPERNELFDLCSIPRNGPGILPRILAQQKTIRELTHTHQAALTRYYAATALEGFYEETLPPLAKGDIYYQPIAHASCLARMDISLGLLSHGKSADEKLLKHLHYWLQALTQSQSVLGAMIANTQVQADLDWLGGLLDALPPENLSGLREIKPELEQLATTPTTTLFMPMLAAELRSSQQLRKEVWADPEVTQSFLGVLQVRLLYKPNATVNFDQQIMLTAGTEQARQDCNFVRWSFAYNPMGKITACTDSDFYKKFFDRIKVSQISAGKLAARIH